MNLTFNVNLHAIYGRKPNPTKVYQTLGGLLVPTTPYNKVSINFSFYFAEKLNMHINIYTKRL